MFKDRTWHRWIALVTTIPLLIIFATGLLLQAKRWIPALQPESKVSIQKSGLSQIPSPVDLLLIFKTVQSVPESEVLEWNDIKVIDIRPSLGVARVRVKNGFEVQVDLANGKVLSAAKRYSSLLIEIHEGAYFGHWVRNFIFIPTAFLGIVLTLTGLWMLKKYYLRKKEI